MYFSLRSADIICLTFICYVIMSTAFSRDDIKDVLLISFRHNISWWSRWRKLTLIFAYNYRQNTDIFCRPPHAEECMQLKRAMPFWLPLKATELQKPKLTVAWCAVNLTKKQNQRQLAEVKNLRSIMYLQNAAQLSRFFLPTHVPWRL